MSKLSDIITTMAAQAKAGQASKRELQRGAEIGFLTKGKATFFVRRHTDNRGKTEPPPEAFTREALVFKAQAEQGGLKLAAPTYGRTDKFLFALFVVTRWPGQGPQQATLEEAKP